MLIAKDKNKIVGEVEINLGIGRKEHIGTYGINIRKEYRKMGFGNYLTGKIIDMAKKELYPKPKIIRLGVFSTNKPAISLYKKYGFKKVGLFPKQFRYKNKFYDELIMFLYL